MGSLLMEAPQPAEALSDYLHHVRSLKREGRWPDGPLVVEMALLPK